MAYEELKVSASHMVGKSKYVIVMKKGVETPYKVYLEEAQLNVIPGSDDDCVRVSTKYKVKMHDGRYWWVNEDYIYDTKEDAERILRVRKGN